VSTEPFRTKLYLPAQAAAEAEATIVSWKVEPGSAFSKGDLLAEAESAKANFTFEAPCNGTVVDLLYAEGDTVSFEEPVIEIETSDEEMKNEIPTAGNQTEEEMVVTTSAPREKASGSSRGENIGLLAVGGYLPSRVVVTDELLGEFPDVTRDYMRKVTGISERRWAGDDEKPSDMALAAARKALDKSDISEKDIDGIIVTTTTPDVIMPSTACILQQKLGIRGIPAFDLNAACSGWLYGLVVAKSMVKAGVGSNILVVGVDMQSRLIDKTDKGTYFLFGDGAGATIVSNKANGRFIREEIITADAKGIHMARREFPGHYLPNGGDEVDPYIRLDGYALFRFATESFSTLIRDVVTKSGWEPSEVRWVVPHQANGRILKAAAQKSGVPFDRFYLNIDHVGNTSSASIPLALEEIERGLQKTDRIVFCSVGAGITAASISIEW
jgi:3-oxoacyl-[acyl-carrier-protein] synthase-3